MASIDRILLSTAQLVPHRARRLLRRSARASRFAGALLAPAGRRVVTVSGGLLDGAHLEVDVATEKAFWGGLHEIDLQRLIADVVQPEWTTWDIGAHIGFFTLLLGRLSSRVVAVEADPANAARLRRNVELNPGEVTVVEAAVSDRTGSATLEEGPMSGMHRLAGLTGVDGNDGTPVRTHRVETLTIDDLADRTGEPHFLKIDIEGAEVLALAGAGRVLEGQPVVLCEIHGENGEAVTEVLRGAGYSRITSFVAERRDYVMAIP